MTTFLGHPYVRWHKLPHVALHYPVQDVPDAFEQLVTERVGDDRYQVGCIPFFIRDLALGDVIEGDPFVEHEDIDLRIVRRSGRKVFRVWIDEPTQEITKTLLKDLRKIGALTEKSSKWLYAVDAENDEIAGRIADYLSRGEEQGKWVCVSWESQGGRARKETVPISEMIRRHQLKQESEGVTRVIVPEGYTGAWPSSSASTELRKRPSGHFLAHYEPVWYRHRHFVIHYPVPDEDGYYEQLIAEDLGSDRYRILCIPFFIYDVALGDVIEETPSRSSMTSAGAWSSDPGGRSSGYGSTTRPMM